MASVIRDPNGFKRVQWCVEGASRRTLRLGNVSVRQAEAVRIRVEQILASRSTGVLDAEATRWVESLNDDMHAKLARLGLVEPRVRALQTLGGLLEQFFATLSVKAGTRRTYEQALAGLVKHFGPAAALGAITPLGCDQWRQGMVKAELAPATIAKRIKTARQVFKQAIRWKMLAENPLAEVKAGPTTNRSRMHFVSRADVEKVLEACPDAEWRLIVAMSRFGGIRIPSEIMPLAWSDVDFHKGLIHIQSSKTEAYEGKDRRIIPMFPELRRALMDVYDAAEEGAAHVIAKHRVPCGNLRTTMLKIVKRAGLVPWPKLFHNMRSSRQTELVEKFPIHVVCAWLGNSPAVALGHYLQVRDSDYAAAIADPGSAEHRVDGGVAGTGGGERPLPTQRDVGQPVAKGAIPAALAERAVPLAA